MKHAIAAVLLGLELSYVAVFANPHTAHCQEPVPGLEVAVDAGELARAIEERLTLGVTVDGERVHVRHCRRARGGCAARARRLAQLFVDAGERHGVDPFLLAAMSMKESAFDSDAVGGRGELGLMQLHPRSPWGRRARARCQAGGEACDAVVVDEAAGLLAAALARCGAIDAALGAYNTGRCGSNRYSDRVLRLHVAMSADSGTVL